MERSFPALFEKEKFSSYKKLNDAIEHFQEDNGGKYIISNSNIRDGKLRYSRIRYACEFHPARPHQGNSQRVIHSMSHFILVSLHIEKVDPTAFLLPFAFILTYILSFIVIHTEQMKNAANSAAMFFISGLCVLVSGFQCWNHLIAVTSNKKADIYPVDIQINNSIQFVLCILFFLVSSISSRVRSVDNKPIVSDLEFTDQSNVTMSELKEDELYVCTETGFRKIMRSGYENCNKDHLTSSSCLIIKGYRNPLKLSDLWLLDQRNTSEVVGPAFIINLDKRVKARRREFKGDWERMDDKYRPDTGTTIDPVSVAASVNRSSSTRALLMTMIVTYWPSLLFSGLLKLTHDLVIFANPIILKSLLNFIQHRDSEPVWHGYFYATGLFVAACCQSFILQRYFYSVSILGMNIRTGLVTAVYRKSLFLTNAARREATVGQITNLMSTDAQNFVRLMPYFHVVWSGPFQISVAIALLWRELGVSVLAGLATLLLLVPVNILVARISKRLQEKKTHAADSRIKLISELLNGIKVVKLYAWENSFMKALNALRATEVGYLRKYIYVNSVSFLWTSSPFLVGISTFGVYTLLSERNILDAQNVFVSLTLFNILRAPLFIFPMVTSQLMQAYVSLKRLSKFLSHPEVDTQPYSTEHTPGVAAVIERASFSWDASDGDVGPVLKDISIAFPKGQITTIIGAVGSGKSSLLQALLGQMDRLTGKFNINGTVAYVPQEPWIFNGTIRANILFHKPYNPIKYRRVIEACALNSDLAVLDQGDLTEIGDKGINLSGGQKQRISLARACYADADVYLLDDPLSSVDAHVGLHLLKSVLSRRTGLLRSHTVLLATHSIKAVDFSQYLVFMANGRLVETLTLNQLEVSRLGVGGGKSRICNFLDCCSRQRDQVGDQIQDCQAVKQPKKRSYSTISHSITKSPTSRHRKLRLSSARDEDVISSKKRLIPDLLSAFLINFLVDDPHKKMMCNLEESCEIISMKISIAHCGWSMLHAIHLLSDNADQFDACVYDRPVDQVFVDTEDDDVFEEDKADADNKNNVIKIDLSHEKAIRSGDLESSVEHVKFEPSSHSTTTLHEQAFTGRVHLSVFAAYFRNMNYWACLVILLLFALTYLSNVATTLWLSQWANDADWVRNVTQRLSVASLKTKTTLEEDHRLASDKAELKWRRNFRLEIYALLGVVKMLVTMAATYTYATAHLACASRLHGLLLYGVLRAPVQYFDTVPQGRILNRFSSDIASVDMPLFQAMRGLLNMLFGCLLCIVMACTIDIWMFIPVLLIMAIYIYLQNLYVTTSRQLKRIESITRSPIFSNFTETLLGVNTIRAYQMCPTYMNINARYLDANNRPAYFSILSQRWLAILLEFFGNSVILFVALFSVASPHAISASYSGLVLSYVLGLSQALNWLVRMSADVESEIVAVERIDEYSRLKSEAPWELVDYQPPGNWPHGGIEFENYATRYREDLDLVLKSINLRISAGQRVGIVGRTGSGKSSLVMALFRMIEPVQGRIVIDNLDVGKLGLHDLRSRLTLIPQDPVLFSGTLRFNLDPFEEHSDEEVWSTLDQANLKTFVRASGNGLGLNMPVTEGGSSMSLGQRQLVCLARALLRRTSILILDEATAAVDPATDILIQQTIRALFANATILTIAHRINTIMDYDRIIVLDNGRIVESGNPLELAANPTTRFAALVRDAADNSTS